MRASVLGIAIVCLIPAACGAAAQEHEASDELRIEAAQDRGIDQWRGRQHWLYDQDHQPETTASAPRTENCGEYRVRMPRAGGGSEVKRVQKCD